MIPRRIALCSGEMDLDALKIALAASPDNIPLLMMVAKLEED